MGTIDNTHKKKPTDVLLKMRTGGVLSNWTGRKRSKSVGFESSRVKSKAVSCSTQHSTVDVRQKKESEREREK